MFRWVCPEQDGHVMQAPDVLHIPMKLASKANVQLSKDVKVTSSGTPQLSRRARTHLHMGPVLRFCGAIYPRPDEPVVLTDLWPRWVCSDTHKHHLALSLAWHLCHSLLYQRPANGQPENSLWWLGRSG